MSQKITGVGGVLSAAHRDKKTGALHGHTWEVTVWVESGCSALDHQDCLQRILSKLDHTELPMQLAWGEDIAEFVAHEMAKMGVSVVGVDVARSLERIYARWVA